MDLRQEKANEEIELYMYAVCPVRMKWESGVESDIRKHLAWTLYRSRTTSTTVKQVQTCRHAAQNIGCGT